MTGLRIPPREFCDRLESREIETAPPLSDEGVEKAIHNVAVQDMYGFEPEKLRWLDDAPVAEKCFSAVSAADVFYQDPDPSGFTERRRQLIVRAALRLRELLREIIEVHKHRGVLLGEWRDLDADEAFERVQLAREVMVDSGVMFNPQRSRDRKLSRTEP